MDEIERDRSVVKRSGVRWMRVKSGVISVVERGRNLKFRKDKEKRRTKE